jgi:iron complex outermembrane recepter protein
VPIALPTNNNLNSTQTTEQTGAYAQHQGKWGGLNTQIGIRYDDAPVSTFDRIANKTTDSHDTAWSKRAGALYLFDSGVAPYVSYSESFAPTPNLLDRFNQPLKPSTGQQYEAGIKYQPKGYSALFTIAAFDLKRQNASVIDPASATLGRIVYYQIGETVSRGIEVEGRFSLSKSLDVVGAYTYLDTKVTSSNNITEFAGKMPLGVPRNNASLWGDYTFRGGPLSGFGAAMGVRYVGETFADVQNTVSVPSYTLVDAAIHYELGDLSPQLKGMKLQVNATNLFNRTYVASCASTTMCFYGLNRNVIGTLTYRW